MSDTAIVVRAIIMHRGAVLLLRRALDDDYRPGEWDLPGGGWAPEDGTYQDGVARETFEESGVVLPASDFELVRAPNGALLANGGGRERHVFYTQIAWWRPRPKVVLSSEHEEGGWYPRHQALALLEHPYYHAVLQRVLTSTK